MAKASRQVFETTWPAVTGKAESKNCSATAARCEVLGRTKLVGGFHFHLFIHHALLITGFGREPDGFYLSFVASVAVHRCLPLVNFFGNAADHFQHQACRLLRRFVVFFILIGDMTVRAIYT